MATFQSMHTVVLLEPLTDRTTTVACVQPGFRSGEPYDAVLKHFRWGNGWTLEQLKKRFDDGPVDWAQLAAEAQKAATKKCASFVSGQGTAPAGDRRAIASDMGQRNADRRC